MSIWTSSDGAHRDGWTISSMLVADGEPGELVAMVNEDADWWDLFRATGTATVNVLGAGQGPVSEAFARLAPSRAAPSGRAIGATRRPARGSTTPRPGCR
ncbi:hypothetical protein G7085_10535 [Tessaracoccus sp. HDW20]|nr:hypothetical protein [Tessaracoccus coleopterorum]